MRPTGLRPTSLRPTALRPTGMRPYSGSRVPRALSATQAYVGGPVTVTFSGPVSCAGGLTVGYWEIDIEDDIHVAAPYWEYGWPTTAAISEDGLMVTLGVGSPQALSTAVASRVYYDGEDANFVDARTGRPIPAFSISPITITPNYANPQYDATLSPIARIGTSDAALATVTGVGTAQMLAGAGCITAVKPLPFHPMTLTPIEVMFRTKTDAGGSIDHAYFVVISKVGSGDATIISETEILVGGNPVAKGESDQSVVTGTFEVDPAIVLAGTLGMPIANLYYGIGLVGTKCGFEVCGSGPGIQQGKVFKSASDLPSDGLLNADCAACNSPYFRFRFRSSSDVLWQISVGTDGYRREMPSYESVPYYIDNDYLKPSATSVTQTVCALSAAGALTSGPGTNLNYRLAIGGSPAYLGAYPVSPSYATAARMAVPAGMVNTDYFGVTVSIDPRAATKYCEYWFRDQTHGCGNSDLDIRAFRYTEHLPTPQNAYTLTYSISPDYWSNGAAAGEGGRVRVGRRPVIPQFDCSLSSGLNAIIPAAFPRPTFAITTVQAGSGFTVANTASGAESRAGTAKWADTKDMIEVVHILDCLQGDLGLALNAGSNQAAIDALVAAQEAALTTILSDLLTNAGTKGSAAIIANAWEDHNVLAPRLAAATALNALYRAYARRYRQLLYDLWSAVAADQSIISWLDDDPPGTNEPVYPAGYETVAAGIADVYRAGVCPPT